MRLHLPALALLAAASFARQSAFAAGLPAPPETPEFITALCASASGDLDVGTEGAGVWHFDAKANQWTRFTRQSTGGTPEPMGATLSTGTPNTNALGDDCAYALARDRQGRLWVGHLNHGVSVFDGKAWRNYDALSGPLGERVFDIQVSPVDGDVWMATSRGLARYRVGSDQWEYFVQGHARQKQLPGLHRLLPTHATRALAFAEDGTLFVGTACEGLLVCKPTLPQGDYETWRSVRAVKDAAVSAGKGLPSDQIHAVRIMRGGAAKGKVFVATRQGLAFSTDAGVSFSFIRGRDAGDRKGTWQHPGLAQLNPDAKRPRADDIRSMAEDAAGRLWLGYWGDGAEAVEAVSCRPIEAKKDAVKHQDFACALAALPDQVVLGWFGGGLGFADNPPVQGNLAPVAPPPAVAAMPSFPSPAAPLAPADVRALAATLEKPKDAQFLGEDWSSGGDWVGRYGRQYGVVCASHKPNMWPRDREYCLKPLLFQGGGGTGPRLKGDGQLEKVSKDAEASDINALWICETGGRCGACWNDQGVIYPRLADAPNVQAIVDIKAEGVFRLSAYFHNADGHDEFGRYRDYLLELKACPKSVPIPKPPDFIVEADPAKMPTLAQARVHGFSGGGVYERFAVKGPGRYLLQIHRSRSYDTRLKGVFVDRLAGVDTETDWNGRLAGLGWMEYAPGRTLKEVPPAQGAAAPAGQAAAVNKVLPPDDVFRVLALRASPGNEVLRWQAGLWTEEDRKKFHEVMVEGHRAIETINRKE